MQCAKQKDPIPIQRESSERPSLDNEQACSELWAMKLQAMPLTLDFSQLLKETQLTRSKAYEKMQKNHANFDPSFPQGIPLYDSDRSPKFWWSHEVVVWLTQRDQMTRKRTGEN